MSCIQVTGGQVRFMRRVQAQQYEPTEAELTLAFNVPEGDDYRPIAETAAAEIRDLVHRTLKGDVQAKNELLSAGGRVEQEEPEQPKQASKPKRQSAGRKKKDDTPKQTPAEKAQAEVAAVEDSIVAMADDAPETTQPEDDLLDIGPAEENEVSPQDLHQLANSIVTSNRGSGGDVKAILAAHGMARVSDGNAETRRKAFDALMVKFPEK